MLQPSATRLLGAHRHGRAHARGRSPDARPGAFEPDIVGDERDDEGEEKWIGEPLARLGRSMLEAVISSARLDASWLTGFRLGRK